MKKVIALIGPTASYKTYFSIRIAKSFNLEIINGDSVQLHKDLNIGSAKITKDEMQGIKHHLLDIVDADYEFSVADYQNIVRNKINELDIPFIVGGTGLYIKSVLYNYEFTDEKRNLDLEKQYENYTNLELYQLLQEKNQKLANKYHMNNRKRILRALELSNSDVKNKKDELLYDALIIMLDIDRNKLYEKIDLRVDKMINDGLVDEVKELKKKNIYVNVIGYKEIYSYLNNEISLDEAIFLIKKNTRHLAKRQLTFFNNQFKNIVKIKFDYENIDETFNNLHKCIKNFLEK